MINEFSESVKCGQCGWEGNENELDYEICNNGEIDDFIYICPECRSDDIGIRLIKTIICNSRKIITTKIKKNESNIYLRRWFRIYKCI